MTPLTTFPDAVLETIRIRLANLFLPGAKGDMDAARRAAGDMLDAYHPKTLDELRVAANIIVFSFQTLEALGQAAAPDMPLTRVLRLRGGAVSLSREATKAEQRLAQLQQARQHPTENRPATIQPDPQPSPRAEKAAALIQDTATVAAAAKIKGLTWTQAHDQRQRDLRLAASRQRAEAKIVAMAETAIPNRQATQSAHPHSPN